jgi:hypothetical protein
MSTATTNTTTNSAASKTKTVGKVAEQSTAAHVSAADVMAKFTGKRMYRMSTGEMVELPADMSAEDAAQLEAEGNAAKKKLGKGPGPKPVPNVKEKAKVKDKKDGKEKKGGKKGAKGEKGAKGKGKGGGGKDGKGGAIKGKVGAWLMAKGAPVIAKGKTKLQQLKKNEQTHDDAGTKLKQTLTAVVPPVVEGQSNSNSSQVQTVDSKPAPQPSEAQAKQKLNEAISDNIPKNIEDVDNFKSSNKAGQMSAAAAISITKDKNEVATTFGDMKQQPPPTPSDVKPEPLPPEEVAPPTAKMNLGADTIAPLQKEHTDVSKFTKDADSKLKEEGVTQEQLDMVDSGDLAEANKEKKGMEKKAKTEPQAINKFAQQENKKVDTALQQEETKERDAIKNERKQKLNATKQKQQGTKTDIEKKREEVANKINGIYKRAQEKVTTKLADLETNAMKRFDDGNEKATKEFENTVKRELDAFKDDRYSGFWGWARKAKDWLLGMEDLPRVKAIFENNRTIFVNTVNALVDTITQDNKKVIQECKDELTAARTEIKAFVDKLGPELKDAGNKAQEEMNSQLDELDKTINKKEEELQNKLQDKQKAAIKAIDEKIEKMKEEMSGALSKLGKLLLLAAKKFFSWALEKFGFSLAEIDSIINKGAAVLKAIFTQPIQFVKNLMNAAITGFKNFGKNFLKHLKDALFEWLTGSLEGLTLPAVWDFKGIISVGLQMIGISYQNIRKHMVTVMGENVVGGLEKTFTLVKTLITDGPMAAWDQLKTMAGEMRDAFVDAVKDFIKTKIIEQAIQWIVSLFVPGAGIIKAIVGIYDTIVFFINKAKQIMQMISNFLGSISEIASGNVGAAADAMENGLARGLSLVINFLAQLLHLNGVTDKIKAAIQKIRDKVDAVLLKVAKWIAEKAKQLWGGVKSGAAAVANWFRIEKPVKLKNGEAHTLKMDPKSPDKRLQIHTSPQPFLVWVNANFTEIPGTRPAHPLLVQLQAAAQNIENMQTAYASATTDPEKNTASDNITAAINALATLLGTITPNVATNAAGVALAPPTIFTYGGVDSNGFGQWAKAEFLSTNAAARGNNNEAGNMGDSDNVTGWDVVRRQVVIVPPFGGGLVRYESAVAPWIETRHHFVRGHLMNGKLGGGAFPYNLTPITGTANNSHALSHFHQVERRLQNALMLVPSPTSPPKVFNYEVHAIYGGHPARGRAALSDLVEEAKLAGKIQRSKLRMLGTTPADVAERSAIETRLYNINRVFAYAGFETERLSYEERNLPQGFLTEDVELQPVATPSAPPAPATPARWAPVGAPQAKQVNNTLPPFIINPAARAALP